jgi:hypothetical protein
MSGVGGREARPRSRNTESRRQQDRVTACRQVDVVFLLSELVCGEVPDPLGLEGEQDDQRSGCPGLDGEGLVGQAALQKCQRSSSSSRSAGS